MAVKSKTQLASDIAASTFSAPQQVILDDMVDSYEDIFSQLTTVQRDLLTPTNGQIIYNTDNDRYEYWNGVVWFGIGQDLSTPLVVKVDLTSAQILALFTTPITVAAAVGAGYSLLPQSLSYRYTYGSAAYVIASTGIVLCHSTKAASAYITEVVSNTILQAGASRSGITFSNTASSSNALVENDSLQLKIATGNPTTGDGTLTMWITYSIITW